MLHLLILLGLIAGTTAQCSCPDVSQCQALKEQQQSACMQNCATSSSLSNLNLLSCFASKAASLNQADQQLDRCLCGNSSITTPSPVAVCSDGSQPLGPCGNGIVCGQDYQCQTDICCAICGLDLPTVGSCNTTSDCPQGSVCRSSTNQCCPLRDQPITRRKRYRGNRPQRPRPPPSNFRGLNIAPDSAEAAFFRCAKETCFRPDGNRGDSSESNSGQLDDSSESSEKRRKHRSRRGGRRGPNRHHPSMYRQCQKEQGCPKPSFPRTDPCVFAAKQAKDLVKSQFEGCVTSAIQTK